MDPAVIVAAMLSRSTLAGLPESDALRKLAELVDAAQDSGSSAGLSHALALAKTLRPICSTLGLADLDYYEGNAWSALRHLRDKEGADPWSWERTEFEQEVICMRRALLASEAPGFPVGRQLQILTNLGNLMSTLGRTVEAIDYYDRALARDPEFGMALGNRGQVFATYSAHDYDPGHRAMLLSQARDDFANATKYPLEGNALEVFLQIVRDLDKRGFKRGLKRFDLNGFELGSSAEERRFQTWALKERLFINTLNDLGPFPVAANDVLQLPTIVTAVDAGTTFHGFFNQLKQEFAAARWFAYEALEGPSTEAIADRELKLLDARDGAVFGLRLEKLKFSFRASYSLLDKIAVFLNAYLALGLPAHKVTLRTVWYEAAKNRPAPLHPNIPRNNLPLRGLFWLAKDFAETDPIFVTAMEPDAQEVALVRNRLEHQFLRVTPLRAQLWKRDLALNISEELLQKRTLRLLHSARAAMIYLVLAIHSHEKFGRARDPSKLVVSDQLGPLEPDGLN